MRPDAEGRGVARRVDPVGRAGVDLEFPAAGQFVFKPVDGRRHDLDTGGRGAEIQQRVVQAEIQQAPFPVLKSAGLVHAGVGERDRRFERPRGGVGRVNGGRVAAVIDRFAPDAAGKRKDAAHPGAFDVDHIVEIIGCPEPLAREVGGLVERAVFPGGQCGRFNDADFLHTVGTAFRQQGYVVLDCLGEDLVDQPGADERVLADHDNQGVQTGRLHARGEHDGKIQARGLAVFDDHVRGTDFLAGVLEAGGGWGVCDPVFLQRRIYRGHDFTRAARVAGLIGVD